MSTPAAPERSPNGGIIRAARRPPDFLVRGPAPQPPDDPEALAPLWPGPSEDLCWLAGNWRILQRTDGHRFSLDDLMTAYTAATLFEGQPPPARTLDLGCGIGSVLLFTAWRFPTAIATGIEAQEISAGMARRSIAWNGITTRCEVINGDFREPEVAARARTRLAGAPGFDLITGTPPYFPPGTGLESENVQRAPCRFEHRGGVEAYCGTAASLLAPGAPFVICAAPGQVTRLITFAPKVGLAIETRRDIIPRTGKSPLLSIFTLRHTTHARPHHEVPPLCVRDATGTRT
ncbi:MAG TPA: SAM-dependent methyltransferase, partial [Polyangia bacterium]